MKSTIDFKLNVPFEYAVGGGVEIANLLVLNAPSNKQRFQRAKLKEFFYLSFASDRNDSKPEAETPKEDKNTPPPTEEEFSDYVLQMLYSSDKVKITEVVEEFKQLLLSENICKVEGSVALTQALYEKMDADDCERLMGTYMVAFILASFYMKITQK